MKDEQKELCPFPVMPECPRYATAYVPYQYMCNLYEPEEGLHYGSMFPELVDNFTKNI